MTDKAATALVTGGARGMGLACAVHLSRSGRRVAILDNDAEALGEAMAASGLGHRDTRALKADVTNADEVASAVSELTSTLGPPTILVNAAGILRPTKFM